MDIIQLVGIYEMSVFSNVLVTNNVYLVIYTRDVCHGNECNTVRKFNWHSVNREVKTFDKIRLSLEIGIRQTWFHLYVSGSVYNQIHVHILIYYVCHAVLKKHGAVTEYIAR